MRAVKRMTVVGLMAAATVALGSVALASPASASDATNPVASTTATTAAQPVAGTPLDPYPSGSQTAQQSSAKWKGGASRDLETGTWRATITRGDVTILLGHYETEKEARKAARDEARELNGVMDGPGCDPPFVLC